ncbi:MAG: hypothetical protein JWN12_470 [Candidatus Saccharibacteria bacterium]|nr:hypothetical protein [Candidatus Saccharibacteria bacterium]
MKITKKALASFAGSTALALVAVFVPTSAFAATDLQGGINAAQPSGAAGTTTLFGDGSIFNTIVNILLFLIGAISVIMLIIGGIRYTISAGDSGNVTAAKNTIMYAIIGLIIAFLAFAIVNWVLKALTNG